MTKAKRYTFAETAQRAHDYRHLIARWRRVARDAGLKLAPFARAGDYPVFSLQTHRDTSGGLYLSAGIHGDEPAATEGLIHWAEKHLAAHVRSKSLPLMILPCLNPWGLVNNHRSDSESRDLNRLFDRSDFAPVRELKELLVGRTFQLGLNLHEDYDGRGIYLYEINPRPPDFGPGLLQAASAVLPIDERRRIDGRPFQEGLALRRANLARFPLHPEAIYLHLHHGSHVITFETPSEFSLGARVHAHVLLIEECIRRLGADRPYRQDAKTRARRPTNPGR
jgi:protein MpaA